MTNQGATRAREDGRHWLPSQGVDPAPLAELNDSASALAVTSQLSGLLTVRNTREQVATMGARACRGWSRVRASGSNKAL